MQHSKRKTADHRSNKDKPFKIVSLLDYNLTLEASKKTL